ncbi:MAG: heavy-metal-associated domain-containing protein [Acholeplasmataceae bacterium]|nr:heavy-metal-associated domain-containing protein [Acholeplasmataceae bacterium]
MPVLYVSLKGLLHCTGCMTTIENALYSAGAKYVEYDIATQVGKIGYDEQDADKMKLVDAVKRVGYDLEVLEISEQT